MRGDACGEGYGWGKAMGTGQWGGACGGAASAGAVLVTAWLEEIGAHFAAGVAFLIKPGKEPARVCCG